MPIALARLFVAAPRAQVSLAYGEDTVTVTYNPAPLTPAYLDEVETAPLNGALAEVLIDADVVDADGAPVRPDADPDADRAAYVAGWAAILAGWPLAFRRAVLSAILEDYLGGNGRAPASASTGDSTAP